MNRFANRRALLGTATVAAPPPPSGLTAPVSQGTASDNSGATTIALTTLTDIAVRDLVYLAIFTHGLPSLAVADFQSDGTTALGNSYTGTIVDGPFSVFTLSNFYTIAASAIPAGSQIIVTASGSGNTAGKGIIAASAAGPWATPPHDSSQSFSTGSTSTNPAVSTSGPIASASSLALGAAWIVSEGTTLTENNGYTNLVSLGFPGDVNSVMEIAYFVTETTDVQTYEVDLSTAELFVLGLDIFTGA
jgi:hypothetical protein